MKRSFKVPKSEQYGNARVLLGYYPNKDVPEDSFLVAEYEDNEDVA